MSGVRQAPEGVRERPSLLVAAATLVVVAACVGVALWRVPPGARVLVPDALRPDDATVGRVEVSDLSAVSRAALERGDALRALRSYGWVDRDAGIARVPLADALDLYLAGARPAPDAADEEAAR